MSTTATYMHLSDGGSPPRESPATSGAGATVDVCLHVEFSGVPEGLDASTVNNQGLWFEGMARAEANAPPPWEGADPSSDVARAHPGARQAIRLIAARRGFEVEPEDITYAGG